MTAGITSSKGLDISNSGIVNDFIQTAATIFLLFGTNIGIEFIIPSNILNQLLIS